MQFHDFNLVQKGPKINIAHWRVRAVPRASVGVPENFFIAFLDELDNFKSFEPYFFLAVFWAKNRQFGDLATPLKNRTGNHQRVSPEC